jgi:hypothetical protein
MPALLSKKHFAARLGISPRAVNRLMKDGKVKTVRLTENGWPWFPSSEVDRLRAGDNIE